jgi:DNA-binding MarR family transcriptional regulator
MEVQKLRKLREKLRVLERESMGVFDVQQECCGLTFSQCHTLLEIGLEGEVSLVELATSMRLDTSTLSRAIQGLVVIGLVVRTTNEKDRRYVNISLSAQGRKVYEEIDGVSNAFLEGVFERLPAEAHDRVVDDLGLFADAVRATNEASGCCRKGKRS